MEEGEFTPFYEVFENFTPEEHDHIHYFLARYKKLMLNSIIRESTGSTRSKGRIEADAILWILRLLKYLEPLEDE